MIPFGTDKDRCQFGGKAAINPKLRLRKIPEAFCLCLFPTQNWCMHIETGAEVRPRLPRLGSQSSAFFAQNQALFSVCIPTGESSIVYFFRGETSAVEQARRLDLPLQRPGFMDRLIGIFSLQCNGCLSASIESVLLYPSFRRFSVIQLNIQDVCFKLFLDWLSDFLKPKTWRVLVSWMRDFSSPDTHQWKARWKVGFCCTAGFDQGSWARVHMRRSLPVPPNQDLRLSLELGPGLFRMTAHVLYPAIASRLPPDVPSPQPPLANQFGKMCKSVWLHLNERFWTNQGKLIPWCMEFYRRHINLSWPCSFLLDSFIKMLSKSSMPAGSLLSI